MKKENEIADLLGEPRPDKRGRLPGGRSYNTPKMRRDLLRWLASGKTLRAFCLQANRPTPRSVYHWRQNDPEFNTAYLHAIEIGCDMLAQECLRLADRATVKDVGVRQLQINTRLKLLQQWDRRYGKKLQLSSEDDHPLEIKRSDEDTMREILSLLAVAKSRQLSANGTSSNGDDETARLLE